MKRLNILHYMSVEHFSSGFLREALIAFSFNVGGLVAGFTIASQLDLFQLSPWVVAVYPTVLTGRGVVSGLISGRLSTALHMGTIVPRFMENTKSFYTLVKTAVVLTLVTTLSVSTMSMIFGVLLWGIVPTDFLDMLAVALATMLLGMVNTIFTIEIAFISYKRALDPDVIVYPVMSTVADLVVTACYVSIVNLFFLSGTVGRFAVFLLALLLVAVSLKVLWGCVHEAEFVRTIKESMMTLLIVAFLVNTTGTVVREVTGFLRDAREVFTVYPALISTVGGVSSIVGSTATTKLSLGLLEPSFPAIRNHMTRILATWAASAVMFVAYAFLSILIQGSFTTGLFLSFLTLLLLANVIAVSAIVLISFSIAIQTFNRGLDPDNFVIPVGSALADGLTSIALLAALYVVG